MRFFSLSSCVIFLLLFTGCLTSTKMLGSRKNSVPRDTGITRQETRRAVKDVNYTFLDSLNENNEIVLRDTDLEKGNTEQGGSSSVSAATESLFRVQVFASNSIETIRERKKELEKSTNALVQIGYEAPYYKLYAGGFTRRQDAQVMLAKLKKIGYLDAWIVTTKDQPQ